MKQPRWDDDAVAWRTFAGALRERMGAARRRAVEAEGKLQGVWERGDRWRDRYDRLLKAKRRDGWMLDRLESLLHDDDVAGAVDVLAERRAGISAARRSSASE
ncbi:hypothetical protein [Microbacterium esteraromaticum]|uniref:hypothetical protein n=1 Tax=Microbacterium esteraromaticum TaxID=57043 RepID=UPI0019D3CE3F|nr:hypothetical protein [Microbacterium esteraromaticum]MBN7792509.1 hypothetical protein [Microbacterium esteraromaticum]